MIKLFAILIGLSFAACCLGLCALIKILAFIYPDALDGAQLPNFTRFCMTLNPWLLVLAVAGLIYPTILLFKKNVQAEAVLVYSGIVIFIGTLLFFLTALALAIPWIKGR